MDTSAPAGEAAAVPEAVVSPRARAEEAGLPRFVYGLLAGALVAVLLGGIGASAPTEQRAKAREALEHARCFVEEARETVPSLLSEALDKAPGAILGALEDLPAFAANHSLLPRESGAAAAAAEARRLGLAARHPVAVVPGFVSSGLELWSGEPCAKRYFRARMWGTPAMLAAFLRDRACWLRHMELDLSSDGLDPEGIRLRAAAGWEAVDFFFPGYFVWGPVVEALGAVGYDPHTLEAYTFDWRLSPRALQSRDGYFSKLQKGIEAQVEHAGHPALVVSHSYGSCLVRSFLAWVDERSPGWTAKHVHTWMNVAGPLLGLPKAVSALLSGEMKDTAQLGQLATVMASTVTGGVLSPNTLKQVFRTWPSLYAMLPYGGSLLWGNATAMVRKGGEALPVDAALELLAEALEASDVPQAGVAEVRRMASSRPRNKPQWLGRLARGKTSAWDDPFAPLPAAAGLRVVCAWGAGMDTETAYDYTERDGLLQLDLSAPDAGVTVTDGDSTVPLMSLGWHCRQGWKGDALNPAGAAVTTREYPHSHAPFTLQGGGGSSAHVDILGNQDFILDLLRLAAGEAVTERIFSDVDAVTAPRGDVV